MTFRLPKIASVLIAVVALLLAGTVAFAAEYLLGDVDSDQKVTIIDATCIQRKLAELEINSSFCEPAADVDRSGKLEITDATYIQRWLADLETPFLIGERFELPTDDTTEPSTQPPTQPQTEPSTQKPTQPSTQPPTQPSTEHQTEPSTQPTEFPTDEEGWGREIFKP